MIGLWFVMMALIITGLVFSKRNTLQQHPKYLRLCTLAIPLPYISAESGWILAETGRQPWVIHDILPTFMGTSSISLTSVIVSLVLFAFFYAVLISVELFLMFKFARKGPSTLGTGRYSLEHQAQ